MTNKYSSVMWYLFLFTRIDSCTEVTIFLFIVVLGRLRLAHMWMLSRVTEASIVTSIWATWERPGFEAVVYLGMLDWHLQFSIVFVHSVSSLRTLGTLQPAYWLMVVELETSRVNLCDQINLILSWLLIASKLNIAFKNGGGSSYTDHSWFF